MPIDLSAVKWDDKPDLLEVALAAENAKPAAAALMRSLYQQESGSGKNTTTSNAGAVGGAQIIPSTFASVADKGWNIKDQLHNLRAGIRYATQGLDAAGGDPALAGAYYYGGPGGMEKARKGIAVSDPRNPNAPNTLQYGQQVAARIPKGSMVNALNAVTDAVIPSAQAETAPSQKIDLAAVKWDEPADKTSSSIAQGAGNLVAGALRGAGSIGATLVAPIDMAKDAIAGKGLSLASNRERRQGMDDALQTMGAEPDSWMYKGGKLAGEIAGTAGAGGLLAKPLQALAGSKYAAGIEPLIDGGVKALQTGGFRVGELAGTGAGTLARIAGGAATGGAAAGMTDPNTVGMGALIGGALPGGAQLAGKTGGALRDIVTGGGASPEVAALARRAKELGINIPADRLVDSKPLNALSASLNYMPMSGRAGTESAMNSQLNKALSKTFGQDSSNVTQALRKADQVLGGQFESTLRNNTVKFDKQLFDEATEVYNTASKELGSDALRPIASQIDELISKGATGEIDGQAAYNIKKTLDRLSGGIGNEAFHATQLKKVLLGALDRSLGTQKAAEFALVRKQYGAMLDLEKLAKNGVEGEISVARLANMKNINNPQMQELADIAAQFVKPREGAHGAAQRVSLGAIAAAVGGFNPATAPILAASVATGRGANMALNSNTLKELMLKPGAKMIGEPASLNLLTRSASRTAPLLSDRQ